MVLFVLAASRSRGFVSVEGSARKTSPQSSSSISTHDSESVLVVCSLTVCVALGHVQKPNV